MEFRRIDRLPPGQKRLLLSAAVVGKDVSFALLRALSDDDTGPLLRDLAALQAAEFLF